MAIYMDKDFMILGVILGFIHGSIFTIIILTFRIKVLLAFRT